MATDEGGVDPSDPTVTASVAPAAQMELLPPEAVGAIPSTRVLSPADSARLEVAATGQLPRTDGGAAAAAVPDSDLARRYCVSVADTAADARIAWQKAKLAEKERGLDQRIAALEAKTAEYKSWLERREEFSRKATATLVQIYARLEPEAAALQLVAMDEETAAAVLTKLEPQYSSAILNEMQPEKAARLTGTIAGAARVPPPPGPRVAAPAAAPAGNTPAEADRGGSKQ